MLASYIRNTVECFHEFRIEQTRSGARGVEQDDLGGLIVETEEEFQTVRGDLRSGEAKVEDRPWAGHGRRSVLFGCQGDAA